MRYSKNIFSFLLRLGSHLSFRRKLHLILLALLTMVTSISEVISLGAVIPFLAVLTQPEVLDTYLPFELLITLKKSQSPENQKISITIAFCLAVIISASLRVLLLWMQTRISFSIVTELSADAFNRTLQQPLSTHLNRNSSEVVSIISIKTNALVSGILMPVLMTASSSLSVVMICTTLFLLNPEVTLYGLISISLAYALLTYFSNAQLFAESEKISSLQDQIIQILQESFGGVRDIILNKSQRFFTDVYRDHDQSLRTSQGNVHIIGTLPRYLIEALGIVVVASIALMTAMKSDDFLHILPMLGAFALGAQRLLPLAQNLYICLTSIRGNFASSLNVFELLDQELPVSGNEKASDICEFKNDIELKDVSFSYGRDSENIFTEINIKIKKGERVGLIGTTGGGKSTLLDIFMGLLEPVSGDLLIDGNRITDRNRSSWQKKLAHVPQTVFLADTTVRSNIAFGSPDKNISEEKVVEAARLADIHRTISNWPSQYLAQIGEAGVRISGGQRQRIGLARALYRGSDILFLDEATSALDTKVEIEVMENIASLPREVTVIMVAHRLSSLSQCDRILKVENGSLLEIQKAKIFG